MLPLAQNVERRRKLVLTVFDPHLGAEPRERQLAEAVDLVLQGVSIILSGSQDGGSLSFQDGLFVSFLFHFGVCLLLLLLYLLWLRVEVDLR